MCTINVAFYDLIWTHRNAIIIIILSFNLKLSLYRHIILESDDYFP